MNIGSSNAVNHSDNEYVLINTRSDQLEHDDEAEFGNIAYDPNIGTESDQLEHEDDAEFANVGYDPNIGIGYVNIDCSNAVMFGGKWIEKMWQGK